MSNETKTTSNKPDFYVYIVEEREGDKGFWNKVGIAYHHKDGKGLNIKLLALPIDGKLTLRVPSEAPAEQA